MNAETLIKVEGVSKKFCRDLKKSLWYGMKDLGSEILGRPHGGKGELRSDEFWALKDVSFALKRGECLGLIGRNGAGKSTLLKMLNGLIKPDHGKISIKGRVGALIELNTGLNPILTGRENVFVYGSILGLSKNEIEEKYDTIVKYAELGDFMNMPFQTYSSGMKVRLGFAVAAQMEPDVLIIDEVLAVGDASFQIKCINTIKQLQSNGVATIIVSHNLTNIYRYCHKGLYLKHGKIDYFGQIVDAASRYLQENDPGSTDDFQGNVKTDSGFILDKIYVTNSENKILSEVTPHQLIFLHVPYRLETRIKKCELALQIGINDYEGVVYQQLLPDQINFDGGHIDDHGEIIITINGIKISSGLLTVGIALWSITENKLLAWSRENKIRIRQKSMNSGRIELSPKWVIATGN